MMLAHPKVGFVIYIFVKYEIYFPNENYNNIKNNAYLWMGKHLARHQQ